MRFKAISIFIFILLAAFFKLIAQEEAKRILLIPHTQLQFHSDFNVKEIAAINDWDSMEVFQNYRHHFIEQIKKDEEQLIWIELPDNEYYSIQNKVPKIYKREPIDHQGILIDPLIMGGELQEMMNSYAADYVLFITKYSIVTRLIMGGRTQDGAKFINWSTHKIAYEIYNKDGKLVALDDGFPIKPKNPSGSTILTKGLQLDLVVPNYHYFTENVLDGLNRYKNRPVYRKTSLR